LEPTRKWRVCSFKFALAQGGHAAERVIAFEPSREAYGRLLSNLSERRDHVVMPFNAAVGVSSGFQMFYEPEGHLTNGSFLKKFSEIFPRLYVPKCTNGWRHGAGFFIASAQRHLSRSTLKALSLN
jgi:hypothetical protein